jgi:hypothetical protein
VFHEFGASKPSSHCSLYETGQVTLTTSKGPSQTGESLSVFSALSNNKVYKIV